MKKLYSLLALLSIFSLVIYAQDNADTQSILNRATRKIQSSKGTNVSFSLTQINKSNQVISTSKGFLKIKGTKYYIKQQENEIFCNGVQIWNYDGSGEVTVTTADSNEDEFSPQQILTGFNKKDFDIKLASSSGTSYQILLLPVDKRKNFKQVILFINKTTSFITKALITNKANAVTEINFSGISINASVPDSQFVFDASKHPGVEIINQ